MAILKMNNVTIITESSGAITITPALTVTADTIHNGNVTMAKNKKVKQSGAFLQSSTHQALFLGA